MSRKIVLTDGQSGYEVIGEYIQRYWEKVCYTTVIVSLAFCDDGNYRTFSTVATPSDDFCVEYLNDWWEGEKVIVLRGITDIDALDICGGIFEPLESEVAERREGVENSPVDCSTPNVTDQKGERK